MGTLLAERQGKGPSKGGAPRASCTHSSLHTPPHPCPATPCPTWLPPHPPTCGWLAPLPVSLPLRAEQPLASQKAKWGPQLSVGAVEP